MAPRKIFRFRYLLVVTKRRFDICKFCVGEAKASPPTASRLSPFASLRAALQGASREKHIRCLCISQRHPPRAAGKVKAKALPNQPILDVRLCAQDGGNLLNKKPRRRWKAGGTEGVPRGNAWVSFLATSWETPRSSIKAGTAHARSSVRP